MHGRLQRRGGGKDKIIRTNTKKDNIFLIKVLKIHFLAGHGPLSPSSIKRLGFMHSKTVFLVIFGASLFPARHKVYGKNIKEFVFS
jgi:hypothetical protein